MCKHVASITVASRQQYVASCSVGFSFSGIVVQPAIAKALSAALQFEEEIQAESIREALRDLGKIL